MAKFIMKDNIYRINGKLAVLISNMAIEENPLSILLIAGQIKEYLSENNDIEEII